MLKQKKKQKLTHEPCSELCSGYLSDQTEGAPPQKKKAEPQQDGDESNLPLTG